MVEPKPERGFAMTAPTPPNQCHVGFANRKLWYFLAEALDVDMQAAALDAALTNMLRVLRISPLSADALSAQPEEIPSSAILQRSTSE
jgi:hypothetical protein